MAPAAAIVGCAGTSLTDEERRFFADAQPLGFILFARNVDTPSQLRALVRSMRETVGRDDAPVLIDQEGGRVARLKPPHWPDYPPARRFGDLARADPDAACRATRLCTRLIAHDLTDLGIDVDCAPVLDVPAPDGHDIIGDRGYGETADTVSLLGRAACDGFLEGRVLPVIKHIPGHGRATADSHLELPRVPAGIGDLEAIDFAPFRALHDAPCAMTAHVLYEAIDPSSPATTSRVAIESIIRGHIGFDGLLFSDDISMQALSGAVAERTRAAISAGCDIALHCNGDISEAREVVAAAGDMTEAAIGRWARARSQLGPPSPFDAVSARTELDEMLAVATT